MSFTRQSANLTPIVDAVFAIVELAKKDCEINGPELVTNATIGSLYDEQGQLVALNSVFEHYDAIPKQIKAAYAEGMAGNNSYRQQVYRWVVQGRQLNLAHSVIATPGGSGAVASTFCNILDEGQTVVLPDIAWGSYRLMASHNNINTVTYSMFDEDRFNLESFKSTCLATLKKQNKLLVVINDPCHNPTGYSMTNAEWEEVIAFINECSKQAPCVILNDIAYIDYGLNPNHTRDYLLNYNHLSDNVLVVVAFSCSKALTSYGLRCGAAVILGKDDHKVREAEIVYEKTARSLWSNIANAAMDNFTWVTTENLDNYMQEKETYIDLMRQRSTLFIEQANAHQLPYYPFREGFFVTLKIIDPELLSHFHQALIEHHIYTVKVHCGIRIALCSLSIKKIDGLAKRMKEILDQCQ